MIRRDEWPNTLDSLLGGKVSRGGTLSRRRHHLTQDRGCYLRAIRRSGVLGGDTELIVFCVSLERGGPTNGGFCWQPAQGMMVVRRGFFLIIFSSAVFVGGLFGRIPTRAVYIIISHLMRFLNLGKVDPIFKHGSLNVFLLHFSGGGLYSYTLRDLLEDAENAKWSYLLLFF